jgi:FkbM family methyltransferase
MENLIQTPKHKDLIYDVGLHRGEDSEFYLRKGFRVVAFEADPDNANYCREKFAEYSRQGRYTIVEGAILASGEAPNGRKKVSFYKNNQDTHWGTVCADWVQRNTNRGTTSTLIEVEAVDFAEAIQQHGMPHYMKVDLQGCEITCVNALRKFAERPDYISAQSSRASFARIHDEIEALSQLGYDSFQAIEQSELSQLQSPPSPAREGNYVAHRFEFGASGLFGAELNETWKSKPAILRLYRMIALGYSLVGDNGLTKRVPGSRLLWPCAWRFVHLFTRAAVPGWYDTHARLGKRGAE